MENKDITKAFVERTAKFGDDIIDLAMGIKANHINRSIISQLVRSGTSIGANYCEAINACSKKDFRNKIFICKKETQETKHWLRMLSRSNPETKNKTREYWKECQEFLLIFQSIINTLNNKRWTPKNQNDKCLNT